MGNTEGGDEGDYKDLSDDLANQDSDLLVYALRDIVGSRYVPFSQRYGFC